jgi:hypothetical protein
VIAWLATKAELTGAVVASKAIATKRAWDVGIGNDTARR